MHQIRTEGSATYTALITEDAPVVAERKVVFQEVFGSRREAQAAIMENLDFLIMAPLPDGFRPLPTPQRVGEFWVCVKEDWSEVKFIPLVEPAAPRRGLWSGASYEDD